MSSRKSLIEQVFFLCPFSKYVNFSSPWLGNFRNWESKTRKAVKWGWQSSGTTQTLLQTCVEHSPWTRPHVRPIVTNTVLFPLQFPVFVSYSASPLPHSHPPNPTSSNDAKMKEVPTFAVLQQFRVAEQVTCHNSGKSLWLDLQANSWHCMVEWQRLMLTLSTQQQRNRSSAWIASRFGRVL